MPRLLVFLLCATTLCTYSVAFRPLKAGGCPTVSTLFLYDLRSQCSPAVQPHPPLEVDGNFLDKALSNKRRNSYACILFHASWCPFSNIMRQKFEFLSSMFPLVEHFTVNQSAALPSVFSRYGIHSFPSILMVNQTSREWYLGEKDIQSLTQFYRKTTGLNPVQNLSESSFSVEDCKNCIFQRVSLSSLDDMMNREPYLVLATLFTLLRLIFLLSPLLLLRVNSFYKSCIRHFNLEIFGETKQSFGRLLHMVDIRRVWTKLRWSKTRNFHARARSCRVWASSFASVSLGES